MMIDDEATSARRKRAAAAAKFKPKHVRLLLVAEAPPCTLDRYFYFEDVQQHDSLFRYVYRGLFGEAASREAKPECLAKMRDAGVFLIDVSENPIADGAKVRLTSDQLNAIVPRCVELKPAAVILIKSNVYDLTRGAIADAGFKVADVRMPFPASGQQKRFETLFAEALKQAGYKP